MTDINNSRELEKSNETKRRIVKTAFSLFKEKSFDNVTINEICQASSISKHTFYYYFNSKDDVLCSFFIIPQEIRAERLHSIITADNYFEQYWLLMEPVITFFQDYGAELTKNYFYINSKRNPKMLEKPENSEKDKLELSIIKKAQEAGDIRNGSDCGSLLKLGYHLTISSTVLWGLNHGHNNLLNSCRNALEISFDVKPELRKGVMPPLCNNSNENDRSKV